MPAPTIRDIAAKLGVGKSTVQRALAGLPGISDETVKRVKAVADELGYRPDLLFSSLAIRRNHSRKRSFNIVYLQNKKTRSGVDVYECIKSCATPLGYEVEAVDPEALDVGKRLMSVLYHRGCVGVIIGSVRPSSYETILNNDTLPVVCCGRVGSLPLHTVQPDITDHVRVVWKRMRAAGYGRIGPAITQHTPSIDDDFDRLGTILACQQELPSRHRIPPLRTPLHDYASLIEWFHRHKPDSVLGFSVGQYYALRDAGIDMSRVGFASLHVSDHKQMQPIAGTEELQEIVAHEAVHMLDHLIRRRVVGIPDVPLHLQIPGRWKDGPSLPPKPPASRQAAK